MAEKPKALRLANELGGVSDALADEAAAELRRLHAVNAELLEALRKLLFADDQEWDDAVVGARAAIAKAEGQQ